MCLLRSPQTSPNTGRIQSLLGAEGPTRAGPTVAPLPLGISVDTGTLERSLTGVRTAFATVDPCDRGTVPRNGTLKVSLPALCFNLDTDGIVSELVVVRNLPYSLAEVSFLCLDSACRSPVATVYFVPFVFFSYVGSTHLAPLVPRCHFQEQSCLNTLVLFISLWCSNCTLVPDDQLHMIACFRCDFTLYWCWRHSASFSRGTDSGSLGLFKFVEEPAAEDPRICGDEGGVTSLRDGEAPWGHACPSVTCL